MLAASRCASHSENAQRHPFDLKKLGMRNRVELTRYAIRRGLVVP